MENLEIADQTPFSLIDESRRHLACHPLYVQVGTETFQNVGDKIEIIVQRQPQEVSRTGPELFFNPGSADYLKLVELYGMKRQGGDEGTLVQKHFSCLPGESQDEMRTRFQAPFRRHRQSLDGGSHIVSASNPLQCAVIAGFNAIFNLDHGLAEAFPSPSREGPSVLQGCQPVQLLLIHAVRPRAYYNADHRRMRKGLGIEFHKALKRSVSI